MSAGDIVLLHFPFSDLTGAKLRPAVVLTVLSRGDFIACQITSKRLDHRDPTELNQGSFAQGGLRVTSYVLPGKLFTAHQSVVVKRVARLKGDLLDSIRKAVIGMIRGR